MARQMVFFVLASLLSLLEIGCSQTDEQATQILEKLQGEWLNKSYINVLDETKSPMKASGGFVTAFKITKVDTVYQWMKIIGFHEAINGEIFQLKPTKEKNVYLVQYDGESSDTQDIFAFTSLERMDEIDWIHDENGERRTLTFIRAKSGIEEYVNGIVLAGNYEDKEGRDFVFSKSGEAKWPDYSFKYQIILDYIDINCDGFSVQGEEDWKGYGFKWENDKLLIFNLEGTDILNCANNPLFILTPR